MQFIIYIKLLKEMGANNIMVFSGMYCLFSTEYWGRWGWVAFTWFEPPNPPPPPLQSYRGCRFQFSTCKFLFSHNFELHKKHIFFSFSKPPICQFSRLVQIRKTIKNHSKRPNLALNTCGKESSRNVLNTICHRWATPRSSNKAGNAAAPSQSMAVFPWTPGNNGAIGN